jgi:hypothetical protein
MVLPLGIAAGQGNAAPVPAATVGPSLSCALRPASLDGFGACWVPGSPVPAARRSWREGRTGGQGGLTARPLKARGRPSCAAAGWRVEQRAQEGGHEADGHRQLAGTKDGRWMRRPATRAYAPVPLGLLHRARIGAITHHTDPDGMRRVACLERSPHRSPDPREQRGSR